VHRRVIVAIAAPAYRSGAMAKPRDKSLIVANKRARYRYEVVDTMEVGIVLQGTEVKTLRDGKVSLDEAFGRIDGDELFLVGSYIQEYTHGNRQNHEPTRKRKLLMRRREIRKLEALVKQQGFALIPLRMYWGERSYAKLELGLCRGRKTVDKRQHLKRKETAKEIRRDYG